MVLRYMRHLTTGMVSTQCHPFAKTSEFECERVVLIYPSNLCTVQVVHRNLNPVWQERFQFVVEDASQDMLMAKVWDHDTFGRVKSLL